MTEFVSGVWLLWQEAKKVLLLLGVILVFTVCGSIVMLVLTECLSLLIDGRF